MGGTHESMLERGGEEKPGGSPPVSLLSAGHWLYLEAPAGQPPFYGFSFHQVPSFHSDRASFVGARHVHLHKVLHIEEPHT